MRTGRTSPASMHGRTATFAAAQERSQLSSGPVQGETYISGEEEEMMDVTKKNLKNYIWQRQESICFAKKPVSRSNSIIQRDHRLEYNIPRASAIWTMMEVTRNRNQELRGISIVLDNIAHQNPRALYCTIRTGKNERVDWEKGGLMKGKHFKKRRAFMALWMVTTYYTCRITQTKRKATRRESIFV